MTMATSTLTSKGQITLPRDVRQSLGLEAGDQVDFVKVDDGFKLVPVRKDVRELKGVFSGYVNRTVSLKEMDDSIARGASGIDD
jgi:antitoxin PrlF